MTIDPPAAADAPPLQGIRVLELASILAGPVTGQFLAELGAEMQALNPEGRMAAVHPVEIVR